MLKHIHAPHAVDEPVEGVIYATHWKRVFRLPVSFAKRRSMMPGMSAQKW